MKHFSAKLLLVITISIFFSNCVRPDDDVYSVEAEINGVKWRGNVVDDPLDGYMVAGDNNSKMKFWISSDAIQTFNFFSNAALKKARYLYKDTALVDWFVGAYDSRMKVKLETTFENDIDHFEIEQSNRLSAPTVFKLIGSIPATGTSTALKQYSLTLDSISLGDLGNLLHRMKIITKSGAYHYTPVISFNFRHGKAQIAWYTNNKLYFALDNDQNQMSIASVGPNANEKTGTFSFNYLNEAGDTIRVKNGKFHLQ
jgi:hypothetical protein